MMSPPERQGLYDPRNEHDACGVGFVANIKGRKSHEVIQCGLECDDETRAQQLEDAAREARSQDEEARADISISTR